MAEERLDPRVMRTRKLIMDAFISLSEEKEFKNITVKDITEKALINRATFYYHFEDIYDLLEKALSEVLMVNLGRKTYEGRSLEKDDVADIFLAVTNFQEALASRCHRGYEDTIARIIRDQIEVIIYNMLINQQEEKDGELRTVAVMLSWAVYGASEEWKRNSRETDPKAFIKKVIPHLVSSVRI
ncbi:TetR/AcrR family transcriptional regulator [Salinicoccus halodurans]|uniref:TetR family transcriptional regulator n=1 Tax=Salinicoccus halodurans TaxID=407035 RepID=A0A0F7HJD5_9STAP|nr:TetR family transcriptional regulator [Salinicoccus halodurans]AKG72857.1 TetR family transcriptional regulator [Salinicoccus halodurans]SFK75200.1 transcriptional regulator, TetR family [Salinicoccus halodurans]